jgi:GNAT superfamily N-acetyltransferase
MIRACVPEDFEAIYTIVNDAAQAYKGVIDAGVRFWGYEEDGALVGVMGIQDVPGRNSAPDVTLIRHAYVYTVRRGQGIGSQLLAHLRTLADRPILIGTWSAATWAIRFYEKHGFRQVLWEEKERLLRIYWDIPERQVETSVVLAEL